MAEARRMGKSDLFSHFADRFEMKRTQARDFFDELTVLSEKELKRSGEYELSYDLVGDDETLRVTVKKRDSNHYGYAELHRHYDVLPFYP